MALLPSAGQTDPSVNNGQQTGLLNSALNLIDPANIRKQISGLYDGGIASLFNRASSPTTNIVNASDPNNPLKSDWRVRVSLPPSNPLLTNNALLSILSQPGRPSGLVFPYTPSISVTHNARYQEQALTHSNYKNYFYEGSDVSAITISGDFTVQNHDDAIYLLASIFFLRSCTKMFWGSDENAGNPPPIVFLDGYGDFYFPHVSCVVTSFQHTMPADCDYIEVKYSDGSGGKISSANQQVARLPTQSQLSVTLQPIYSRKNIANNMSLSKFSQGHLLKGNGGFL
jgi:hypothetical protein